MDSNSHGCPYIQNTLSTVNFLMSVLIARCCNPAILGDKDIWDTHGLLATYPHPSSGLASPLCPWMLTSSDDNRDQDYNDDDPDQDYKDEDHDQDYNDDDRDQDNNDDNNDQDYNDDNNDQDYKDDDHDQNNDEHDQDYNDDDLGQDYKDDNHDQDYNDDCLLLVIPELYY